MAKCILTELKNNCEGLFSCLWDCMIKNPISLNPLSLITQRGRKNITKIETRFLSSLKGAWKFATCSSDCVKNDVPADVKSVGKMAFCLINSCACAK